LRQVDGILEFILGSIATGPLFEAIEHHLYSFFVEGVGFDSSGAFEDDGVAVFEHGELL
jgi:hypothetical protein